MRRTTRSLPFAEWPIADRTAWERALTPAKRLSRGGAASHLAKASVDDIEKRYGAYLGFLQRHGLFTTTLAATEFVTEQNIKRYIAELEGRVRSTTVYNCVHKLWRAAELLSPKKKDLEWLIEIERDIRLTMQPRSKFDRVVTTRRLVETGLKLIGKARRLRPSFEAARIYRNGLMIAVLAFCPIRLKNFAQLEIGNTFQCIEGRWWIILTAEQTKSRRVDERQIPELLTPFIGEFLEVFRPILAGRQDTALWISSTTKERMTIKNLGGLISKITKSEIGVDVSPHLFRTAAASTAASAMSVVPNLAAGLLGHVDRAITEIHYNRARTCDAAVSYAELLGRIVE